MICTTITHDTTCVNTQNESRFQLKNNFNRGEKGEIKHTLKIYIKSYSFYDNDLCVKYFMKQT